MEGRVWTHLVELVEVPQDDCVVAEGGEQFLPQFPPACQFLFPCSFSAWRILRWRTVLRVRCTLAMIAAEKGVFCKDDVFRVHPVLFVLGQRVRTQSIFQIHVHSPWRQGIGGDCDFIGQDIVAPICAKGAREAHERHLNRSRPRSENLVPCSSCITIQVDKDVDAVIHDPFDKLFNAPGRGIVEDGCFTFNLLAVHRVVRGRGGIAESPNPIGIMEAKNRLHEVGERVIVEVARNVANIELRIGRCWRRQYGF